MGNEHFMGMALPSLIVDLTVNDVIFFPIVLFFYAYLVQLIGLCSLYIKEGLCCALFLCRMKHLYLYETCLHRFLSV